MLSSSDWERFMPWRSINGDSIAPRQTAELEVLLKGIFEKTRFLDLLRHFVVFEVDGYVITKLPQNDLIFFVVKARDSSRSLINSTGLARLERAT